MSTATYSLRSCSSRVMTVAIRLQCKHLYQQLGETRYDWEQGIAVTPATCKVCGEELEDIIGLAFDREIYISPRQHVLPGKWWMRRGYHIEQAARMP